MTKYVIDYNGLRLLDQVLEADRERFSSDKPGSHLEFVRLFPLFVNWLRGGADVPEADFPYEDAVQQAEGIISLFASLED